MKRQLFFIVLILVLAVPVLGFYFLRHLHVEKKTDETKTVYIKRTEGGFQLFKNGKPIYIRGASGNSHFKDLALINGNTIRLYDTIHLSSFLDDAESSGLSVIVDIPIPKYSKNYYSSLSENDNRILREKVRTLVKEHKNHPALLMWNLGNELFYPFVLKKNSFINTFNDLVDIIHNEDQNHPVCTTLAGVSRKSIASIYLHSPGLDLLSFNVFGNAKIFRKNVDQLSLLFGAAPYFISEWGPDGMWESRLTSWNAPIEQTSSKKAEQINTRYNIITDSKDGACLGSLVFFWGNKHELTNSWFSLFKNNYKSEVIKELAILWKNTNTKTELIGLNYMLVDGKGAADNIVFSPGELKSSEIKFDRNFRDSVKIEWEIYADTWYQTWYEETYKIRIKPHKMADSFISYENNRAIFVTPKIEGPYRIFAYVYDKNGYFATTNTPFYVLDSK